jgi:hypothetical protein
LRTDFGVFFDGGFLVAVALSFLLSAVAGGLILAAAYEYGIPPIIPW